MVRPVELVLTRVTGPTPSSTTLKNRTSFFYTTGATFNSFTIPFFLLGTLEESFAIALASFSASFLAFFSASIYALASFATALCRALSAFSASFRALLAANSSFLATFRAFSAASLASYSA
jgi:hypothetical protein